MRCSARCFFAARNSSRLSNSRPGNKWLPHLAYIAAHALFSVEGYCAAALSLRYEAVMLVWVSLIFISNINSAFNFYRASVDESYSPGNKLISGLRDSAVSWAIILPLYWYCEKGAPVA